MLLLGKLFMVKKLIALTNGYYVLEKTENGVLLSDMRFGYNNNWRTGKGEFVFAYDLIVNSSGSAPWLNSE